MRRFRSSKPRSADPSSRGTFGRWPGRPLRIWTVRAVGRVTGKPATSWSAPDAATNGCHGRKRPEGARSAARMNGPRTHTARSLRAYERARRPPERLPDKGAPHDDRRSNRTLRVSELRRCSGRMGRGRTRGAPPAPHQLQGLRPRLVGSQGSVCPRGRPLIDLTGAGLPHRLPMRLLSALSSPFRAPGERERFPRGLQLS